MWSVYSHIVQFKTVTQYYQPNLDQLRPPVRSHLLPQSAPSQTNEQQNWTGLHFREGRFNTTANLVRFLVLKATVIITVFRDVTSCVPV
jgi:hypothetical protein